MVFPPKSCFSKKTSEGNCMIYVQLTKSVETSCDLCPVRRQKETKIKKERFLFHYLTIIFAEGEVIIGEYWPIITEPGE